MRTISYKKRERLDRGKLKSFDELPTQIKEDFKKIKNKINEYYPNTKCYVMGSYYWGFWDDKSDLDLVVDTPIDNLEFIKNSLPEIKFDVLNIKLFREIEIP
jgi:predicted nucleotidyltransferase